MKTLFKNSKSKLYSLISILALVSMIFRSINYIGYEQTSLLFVGVPALIAILIIRYTNKPKTAYGLTFRVITLFLLICSIFFGEGTVCILFMAPIFYGVAALFVALYKNFKPRKKANSFVFIFIILVIAQPNEIKKIGETHSIQNSITVDRLVSLNELTSTKDLSKDLPFFLDQLKFPRPISVKTNGIKIGNTQNIQFLSDTKGIGLLSLEVTQSSKNKITYKIVKDDTHINHWLTWKKIKIEINELESGKSKITWTSSFICDLGPSWYFKPLEKYAVGVMNEHLLSSYFQ